MLPERVEKTIEKYGMLSEGQRVGVGVSGGVDSVVLLHILVKLKERWNLKLIVCHLNHNLRGEESLRDARFVEELAEELGLEFVCRSLPQDAKPEGVSIQDWARKKRLSFFEDVVREHSLDRIALGHNMNDNAETVLMRLLRGASIEGLKGIEPVRAPFIRPLIEVKREEIEEYARAHSIRYVEDSTNRSKRYLRNRIRLELIPYLEKHYNPSIVETLSRLSSLLRRDARYLEAQTTEVFKELAVVEKDRVCFRREELVKLDDAIVTRLFMKATERLHKRRDLMESAQAEQFLRALRGRRPNVCISLGEGLYLKRAYEEVVVTTEGAPEPVMPEETPLKVPGLTTLEGTGYLLKAEVTGRPEVFEKDRCVAYFDYEHLPAPLLVRTFRPGDRMRPLGMSGSRKIKDIFIDEKIPLEERRRIPIVVADGRVIWVAGIRQSEDFRVEENTKRVLRIELLREDTG